MFEDITQMEKEIETFRKNVVASSELVAGITELTFATKQQQEALLASADVLSKKIDSCILQIKKENEATVLSLVNENTKTLNSLHEKMSAEQTSRLAELGQIKKDLESIQAAYAAELQKSEASIREYQKEAEEKYNDFVYRLEATNVDQIFKEVQGLKKSIQSKFTILIGGISITLIATILGVILQYMP